MTLFLRHSRLDQSGNPTKAGPESLGKKEFGQIVLGCLLDADVPEIIRAL